ncbi:LHFPL tetraspan subfamily member 7 protein [Erythrolamprus reginae]|uniref:LHFPL tetraspan subfamily member 7 protein n=1 Tax=Erythrolamprus reginae TaxID=121349 RepID=UPI00396C5CE1
MPPRRKKKKRRKKQAGGGGQAALLPRRPAPAAATAASASLAPGRPLHAAAAPRMFSGVGCFWVLLSCCLVAVCSLGFLSPAWVVRVGRRWGSPAPASVDGPVGGVGEVSFGLLWHCAEGEPRGEPCDALGGLGGFGHIPSASWQGLLSHKLTGFAAPGKTKPSKQAALISEAHCAETTSAVLCVGGCALLAFSALLAVIVLFLPSGHCERRLCTLAGYIQTAAVFIMGFGLLVYPFGLGSSAVRTHCEDSSIYYAGNCQLGWGYMLAIVGVMLSVFLPYFAKYAPKDHPYPTPIPTIL